LVAQGRPAMMPDFSKDYEAGRALLASNGLPVFEAPLHLEGGSIHSDGQGTLVVTEECLLDPSRNPHLGRKGIEQVQPLHPCSPLLPDGLLMDRSPGS
jgi:agmatine deiminase